MPWLNSISGNTLPEPVITAKTGIVLRTPAVRVPVWAWMLGKVFKCLKVLVCLYFKYWWLTLPATVVGCLWWRFDWPGALAFVLGVAGLLFGWWRLHPGSFLRFLGYPYKAKVRRWQLDRRFAQTMVTARLSAVFDGQVLLPVLSTVHCRKWVDAVTVRMLPGQIPADYAKAAPRLAQAFGSRQVKVYPGDGHGQVMLHLLRGDPLAQPVKPLAVCAMPDFTALPLGVQENGEPFALRLLGNQVLVIGATGAGKSSMAWSFIRSLAGGVAGCLVRLWVIDPKGGMELAAGAAMFDRFLCEDFGQMADTLDEAVAELRARALRLRGKTRQHIPTVAEPLTVIVIDELIALTAYADKNLRERIKQSLGVLMTQGRSVGFHLFAMAQDPRKEAVPFRDAFTVRIGLRVNEPEHVDLVLGDGARDRGALCDQIPQTTPGVAYVVLDGDPTPARVRASYLADDDIAAMANTYSRTGVINGYRLPSPRAASDVKALDRPSDSDWVINR